MAQSFNEETLRWKAIPCPFERRSEAASGVPGFSVSTNGRLVFLPPPKTEPQLTWLDRSGRPVGTVGDPGIFWRQSRFEPGRSAAGLYQDESAAGGEVQSDIWLMDLATGRATPLTDDPAGEHRPRLVARRKTHCLQLGPTGRHEPVSCARPMAVGSTCPCEVGEVRVQLHGRLLVARQRPDLQRLQRQERRAICGHCPCRATARPRSF